MNDNGPFDFCFILSDLLSTTPRAYRAIRTALNQGFTVCLVYNKRIKHAVEYNDVLLNGLSSPAFFVMDIEWRKNNVKTLFFKVLNKIAYSLYKKIRFKNTTMLSSALDYTTLWQMHQCRDIKAKVYAGHRPSILPIISYLAKKHNGRSWFDIEDHHFEETKDQYMNQLMHDFIPQFPIQHYTNASALIGKAFTEKLKQTSSSLEILNAPILENHNFDDPEKDPDTVSFIWFSQFVTFHRGLELFFKALEAQNRSINVQINLVGLVDPNFKDYIQNLKLQNTEVIFHGFKPEREILELALNSDIGLSLELPTVDKSRNLAITNKILTYAVCGNFIVATRTEGQINFMKNIPENGVLVDAAVEAIENLFADKETFGLDQIRAMRQKRIKNAQKLSWKVQEEKMIGFLNNIMVCQ